MQKECSIEFYTKQVIDLSLTPNDFGNLDISVIIITFRY